MIKLRTLAIDIGHNVNFDRGAVEIKNEDELNMIVEQILISKCRSIGINVVKKGDTLWNIRKKYGVSVDRLAELNSIEDRNRIYVGKNILVK